jgi:hypothetical protein
MLIEWKSGFAVYLEEVSLESPVWQVNGDFGGLGP